MGRFSGRVTLAALCIALAAPASAVEWRVSLWGERRASTEHVHELARLVADKTDGDFTLSIDYGGLANERENLDGISIGAFEMAQICAGSHPDKTPSLTVLELPFLGVSTLEEEVAVSHAVYDHPAVREDLARWKARLLMASPLPQYNIVGTGEVRDSLDEFEGMRIRATGGIGEAFEAAGAVPTSGTATEAFDAMESGAVDTVAFAQDAHLAFRTLDLATWWTENLDPGTVNCPIVVNADAYEALSPDHRRALESSVDEAIAHYLDNYRELLDEWDATLARNNVERVRISDAQIARFREAAAPIHAKWLADMDQRGLPGRKLYDLVHKTLEDHRAED